MVEEKYHRLCSIGRGACGDVFLVRSTQNQKCYALKRVELDESRKTRRKESVLREAKIMAELRHPHIVKYHESFFDAGEKNLCIILDYCDGGTLEDKIRAAQKAGRLFAEKQIIQWFLQIAMAVRYLHSQKVLHRDLKTENVFLNKSGTICKLGDFGIAKSIDKTVEVSSTCVGTPCYLSPEMCQDIPYTSKADIWALGCILYELCALKPAFDAQNLVSLFYKIVQAEYEPIPENFSDNLLIVLETLLTKEPEERPSAHEVLAMPFLRKELLSYIEENEFKLQQCRLPTREGPRPYTTPSLRDSASKEVIPNPVHHEPSELKRAMTCRPNMHFSGKMPPERRNTISAKLGERVGTIQEESDDQDLINSTEMLQSEDKGDGKFSKSTAKPPKRHYRSKSDDTELDVRSDLTSQEKEILRSVKGMSKTPDPIKRIQAEKRSRSLTPDSAKMSRPLPRQLTRGKENRSGANMLEFDKPYTNLMDEDSAELSGLMNSPRKIKLDLSYRMTSVSRLKLLDGKLPQVSPMTLVSDDKEQSPSSQRKQILEPQRTPRVPVKNALQLELATEALVPEEEIFNEEFTKELKTEDFKVVESMPKKQRHDSDPKVKEKESEPKQQKAAEPESKQQIKLPKPKSKQNEPVKKVEVPKKDSKQKKLNAKDNNKSSQKKTSNQTKKEKKLAKIERQATREGTEIYYSDDFDEDSSCSEIEEDIPEEINTARTRGRSTSTVSRIDSVDIPEDLPDGEEATDVELDAAVTVARKVHDGLSDAEDELVVDTSARLTSANVLIQRHCMKQLGAEKYEKVKKMCKDEASESEIRDLETTLGKENMKTFYLMDALAKNKKK